MSERGPRSPVEVTSTNACPCCWRYERPPKQKQAIANLLQVALDHYRAPLTDDNADAALYQAVMDWGYAIYGDKSPEIRPFPTEAKGGGSGHDFPS